MTEEKPMMDEWTPEEEAVMNEWTPEEEAVMDERTPEEEPVNEERPLTDEDRAGKPVRPATVSVGIGVHPSISRLDGVGRSVS